MTKIKGFKAIYSKAQVVFIYRKNCEILNQVLERKRLRVLKAAFRLVKKTNLSSLRQAVMGLSILNSLTYERATGDLIYFFNQMELLSLVYELVFCRMRVLRWKQEPRFMSVQHLVRSYLQTLWMKNPEKYEYVQDLIEGNIHLFSILLDDLISWHYERIRRQHLLFAMVKIRQHDKSQFKKLEKLIRILNKFNQKETKVHLLEFIGQVNKVRPRESIFSVLHSLFAYYGGLYKQEAFNRMKLIDIKVSTDGEGKRKAFKVLAQLFDRRRDQAYSSMPYRTLFSIGEERDLLQAADVLGNELDKIFKKRQAEVLKLIEDTADECRSIQISSERQTLTNMECQYNELLEKHAELLNSVIQRLFLQELGLPFRKLLWHSIHQRGIRARLANDLYILFMKRYLAGFNQIRLEAEHALNQRLMVLREGFSILDIFATNRVNTAFSQIKTLLIELQTLQVSDVTDSTKIMFKMKDILNTSGNISGNLSGYWDDGKGASRKDTGINRPTQRDVSPNVLRPLSPGAQRNSSEKFDDKKYSGYGRAVNVSLRIDESINNGSRRAIPSTHNVCEEEYQISSFVTKVGKSQRVVQNGNLDSYGQLKSSQSKTIHVVESNLSQDFTKSSSNQDVGIGSRGWPTQAFGGSKNMMKQDYDNLKYESDTKLSRKSINPATVNSQKLQPDGGQASKTKMGLKVQPQAKQTVNSNKKMGNNEITVRREAEFGSERFQGAGAGLRIEYSPEMQGSSSRVMASRNALGETSSKQQLKNYPGEHLNPEDSSKRSTVIKAKRRLTKTINTGKGLNTSGPLLE